MNAVGSLDGNAFQQAMKTNHPLAMEYIARLLRRTVDHNGPVKRHEIDAWLRPEAVEEFLASLTPEMVGRMPSRRAQKCTGYKTVVSFKVENRLTLGAKLLYFRQF